MLVSRNKEIQLLERKKFKNLKKMLINNSALRYYTKPKIGSVIIVTARNKSTI